MIARELEAAADVAEHAADAAREEIRQRFRSSEAFRTKDDGSPVTEADLAAEREIRRILDTAYPDFGIMGEELGFDGDNERPCWVVDPIDGTRSFARGVPLFGTIIALLDEGEPVLGLIDIPMLGERYVGWTGGGCRRNGIPVQVSAEHDLSRAIVSHCDPICFRTFGMLPVLRRMIEEIPMLRGYANVFGHSLVIGGGVDAMVDLYLNIWDVSATSVLIREAGGSCTTIGEVHGKTGVIMGSPALVEQIRSFL